MRGQPGNDTSTARPGNGGHDAGNPANLRRAFAETVGGAHVANWSVLSANGKAYIADLKGFRPFDESGGDGEAVFPMLGFRFGSHTRGSGISGCCRCRSDGDTVQGEERIAQGSRGHRFTSVQRETDAMLRKVRQVKGEVAPPGAVVIPEVMVEVTPGGDVSGAICCHVDSLSVLWPEPGRQKSRPEWFDQDGMKSSVEISVSVGLTAHRIATPVAEAHRCSSRARLSDQPS